VNLSLEVNMMGILSDLPNIGEVVEKQLNDVGITTYEAWLKIRAIDPSACIHRLYALEGAILGAKKNQLPMETKAELKNFFNAFSK